MTVTAYEVPTVTVETDGNSAGPYRRTIHGTTWRWHCDACDMSPIWTFPDSADAITSGSHHPCDSERPS